MEHSSELFRKEAIEGQKLSQFGEAILLPKTNHQVLTAILVSWFSLLLLLLFNASFSSKVSVSGWLVSGKASIDVVAKEPNGVVAVTAVNSGQPVSKGQVLLEITRNTSSLLNPNYQHQIDSLETQHTLLQKREIILRKKHSQQLKQNKGLIASYEQHLRLNIEQQKRAEKQFQDAINDEKILLSLLQKKNIPKPTYHAQKDKRQAIETQLTNLASAKLELELSLLSVEQSNDDNTLALSENLNSLASSMQNLNQQIETLKGARTYTIKSPINGTVHNLQVSDGDAINGTTPLMQIAPHGSSLKALLYVPSNHAGFIEDKQVVKLKLNAFPYQKFGMSQAKVSHVSQQILLPHQVKNLPIQLNEPVFLVEAELNSQQMSAHGTELELKAGMLLQADIALSQRSLLEWLLSPIYSLRGQF
jgi:membrane fusion protein